MGIGKAGFSAEGRCELIGEERLNLVLSWACKQREAGEVLE